MIRNMFNNKKKQKLKKKKWLTALWNNQQKRFMYATSRCRASVVPQLQTWYLYLHLYCICVCVCICVCICICICVCVYICCVTLFHKSVGISACICICMQPLLEMIIKWVSISKTKIMRQFVMSLTETACKTWQTAHLVWTFWRFEIN